MRFDIINRPSDNELIAPMRYVSITGKPADFTRPVAIPAEWKHEFARKPGKPVKVALHNYVYRVEDRGGKKWFTRVGIATVNANDELVVTFHSASHDTSRDDRASVSMCVHMVSAR